jgi:hypothetical protein
MSVPFLAVLFMAPLASSVAGGLFTGTWCVGREGLVITFIGADSIHVTSLSDESIDVRGRYSKKGDRLTASLSSEELKLDMGYHYKVRPDSTLRAKILYFTVNGDSVNHPHRWLRMKRYDPDKGIIPEFDDEEEEAGDGSDDEHDEEEE